MNYFEIEGRVIPDYDNLLLKDKIMQRTEKRYILPEKDLNIIKKAVRGMLFKDVEEIMEVIGKLKTVDELLEQDALEKRMQKHRDKEATVEEVERADLFFKSTRNDLDDMDQLESLSKTVTDEE